MREPVTDILYNVDCGLNSFQGQIDVLKRKFYEVYENLKP